ncbi:MAG: TetR/AcrR family transcriptional regulator [Bacteroidota bacterium]
MTPDPSPVQQRRLEEKEARREQILDAAEQALSKKGFDGVVLADVAAASRLSRGLLYTYFADKVDLFHAVAVRASTELHRRFREAAEGTEPGMSKVHAIGQSYVRFASERPILFEALARSEASEVDLDEHSPNALMALERSQRVLGVVTAAIEAGMEDGSIRTDLGDARETALVLWGVTHGMIQVTAHKDPILGHYGTTPGAVHDHGFSLIDRALRP